MLPPPPLTLEAKAERWWSSFSRKGVVLSLLLGKKRRVIRNIRSAEHKKVLSPRCYTGPDTGREGGIQGVTLWAG